MAVSVSPKAGVGSRLKEARARKGVSLEDAARHTRIKRRFLEALERDAPPSAFRAHVYARAFLREYASFLGLDPEPLVRDYRTAHGDGEPSGLSLPAPVQRRSRARVIQVALIVVSMGVLAWLAVLTTRGDVAPPTPSPEAGAGEVAEPPPPPVVEPPAERGVRLEIRIKGEPSWLRVGSGGKALAKGTRKPGWSRTFEDDKRLHVVLGNAGAVRLFLDGERLGAPGGRGEVYRASFVWKRGAVRIINR